MASSRLVQKHGTIAVTGVIVAVALAAAVIAFGNNQSSDSVVGMPPATTVNEHPGKPAPARPAAPVVALSVATLSGSSFRLSSQNGYIVPDSANYTLSFEKGNPPFEDGLMHAKFCNVMNGPYTLKAGVLDADLTGTKMFCAD